MKKSVLVLTVFLLLPFQLVAEEIYDPFENVNRKIFWFNDQVDIYVLEPVARGYDYITPSPVQRGVRNFFNNLRYPQYLVNDLLQLEFSQAANHTGRFLINSTIGIGGLIDHASHMGLEDHAEDFGLTLAKYGVPPGPYIVIPFLGPSNLRDGIGQGVDYFLDPLYYVYYTDLSSKEKLIISASTTSLDVVSRRARMLDAIETAKGATLDYYSFAQGAYYQYRRGQIGVPEDFGYDEFDDFDDFDDDLFGDELFEPEERAIEETKEPEERVRWPQG